MIDGSTKRICWLSFEFQGPHVIERHSKENNDKCIIAPNTVYFRQAMFLRELDTALENHAFCTQPTDYQLIC